MNYRIVRTNDYLVHHGILGQKWGVRNGPPYPIGHSSKHKSGGLKYNLQFFAKDPKDYDTIYVPENVLSDIRWYIKRRKETKPIVHMEHGNSRYMIDNTKRDNPRVIGEEMIPDSITGLYERIKYEK